MTGITPEGFEIDRDFAAPPAAVFAAWTTAEHFARWFGGKDAQVPADRLDYEPAVGRAWSATMVLPTNATINWAGEFLEVVPDQRLVFTLTDQPGKVAGARVTVELTLTDQPAKPARLTVTVELTPTDSGTHMHMTQEAPEFTDEQRQGAIDGWQAFFDVLQEIAEAA
jgi:uncharacterized protein YndB with AHSA1/START domain